jgi:hypothetical protein
MYSHKTLLTEKANANSQKRIVPVVTDKSKTFYRAKVRAGTYKTSYELENSLDFRSCRNGGKKYESKSTYGTWCFRDNNLAGKS